MTTTQTRQPAPASVPAGPPVRERPTPRRTGAAVVAVVFLVAGLVVLVAGTALGVVSSRRDSAGFFHSGHGAVRSATYALTSDPDDVGGAGDDVPKVIS